MIQEVQVTREMLGQIDFGGIVACSYGDPDDSGAVCGRWLAGSGQPLLSKQERYRWLVDKVKASYRAADDAAALKWCDACDEINLWTYWQGRDCLDAEIMVVGQDWGNPDSDIGKTAIENIQRGRPYLENDTFPTDLNLVTLFDQGMDTDIRQKDRRLFFTNLLLGYRAGNNTGGSFDARMDRDLPFFKELVNIIRPKLVICLGKNTYIHALKAFGAAVRFPKGYNAALDEGKNTCNIDDICFCGMAHCGALGCLNRIGNKKGVSAAVGLRQQIEDWKKIRI